MSDESRFEIVLRVDGIKGDNPQGLNALHGTKLTAREQGMGLGMAMQMLDQLKMDLIRTIKNDAPDQIPDLLLGLGLGLAYDCTTPKGTKTMLRARRQEEPPSGGGE